MTKPQAHAEARNATTMLILLFEGRDEAGKSGTIKRFMQHTNLDRRA